MFTLISARLFAHAKFVGAAQPQTRLFCMTYYTILPFSGK